MARGADVAHGTRDGCDAARKATWQSRASPRDARWREHAVGGHASPRRRPDGATWQEGWQVKGPLVSGPWLEYWSGNRNALPHSTFYTQCFLSFPPCGTIFPGDLNL